MRVQTEPMRVGVLGFALSPTRYSEVAAADKGMPTQTQNFGVSLIQALRAGGAVPFMVSVAPAASFPNNSRLTFRARRYSHDGVSFLELPFINLTAAKHLTRFISAVALGLPTLRREGCEVLLIHGVHSPFLAAGLVLKQLLSVPCTVVLTDPPNVPHSLDTRVTLFLKRIDEFIIRALLSHFDAAVVLTDALGVDFVPKIPRFTMEGIAPDLSEPHIEPQEPTPPFFDRKVSRPEVVYAGGVSEQYGVRLLLDAERKSEGAFHLTVFGKGPLVQSVRAAEASGAQVTYGGVLSPPELQIAYQRADILVNPRPIHQDFVRYSFPSKLIEYMLSGKPVLTTRLPAIPMEYFRFLFSSNDTPEDIAMAIQMISSDPRAAQTRALAGQAFLREEKSVRAQGDKLVKFLRRLIRRDKQA